MTAVRFVVATLTVEALALLAIGYGGPLFAIGDSVGVFRLQLAVLVLAAAPVLWLTGARWLAFAAALAGIAAAGPIAYGFSGFSAGQPGSYVFYQKNLYRREMARSLLTKEILSFDPDFVTLQEITSNDRQYLRSLLDAFDSKLICGEGQETSVGILSRFPLVAGTGHCPSELPVAAAKVRLPDGSTPWLVSLHLTWPYPAGQRHQAARIAGWLERLDGPVMIGGDFNMVSWGSSVGMISRAARTRQARPWFGSYPASGPLLPLPIDHILLPAGTDARVEVRPPYGSDHKGLVARFDFQAVPISRESNG